MSVARAGMKWRSPISSIRHAPMLLILAGLALPAGAGAAVPGASGQGGVAATESLRELDEVAVNGKKWRDLKREMIEAEDRFYKRFNTLNTNDEFDIHCRMDKPTGTIVPQRQCEMQFLVEAGATDGQEFHRGLIGTSANRSVNTPLAVLQPLWLQRRAEYLKTARALLVRDPELLALATRLGRLRAEYDQARN